jgi:hypothetical protein
MKTKNNLSIRWLFGFAVLVFLSGILISALLVKDVGITHYPTMISDAYREKQHRLTIPGTVKVNLMRTGAYGIYYESSRVAASVESYVKMPPEIQCTLTSISTGKTIQGVPDYVETNRYWSKDKDGLGVLVMSLTVDEPGTYAFACAYADDSTQPEITVALGPNYFWEFLRLSVKIALPLLGSVTIFFSAALLATLLLIIVCALKGLTFLKGQTLS